MERNKLPKTINFELESAHSEVYLNIKKELKNDNQSTAQTPKNRLLSGLRIRRFFIRQPRSKRPMEFGCHPTGIHWMGHAIFYSESGCLICKTDLERIN